MGEKIKHTLKVVFAEVREAGHKVAERPWRLFSLVAVVFAFIISPYLFGFTMLGTALVWLGVYLAVSAELSDDE